MVLRGCAILPWTCTFMWIVIHSWSNDPTRFISRVSSCQWLPCWKFSYLLLLPVFIMIVCLTLIVCSSTFWKITCSSLFSGFYRGITPGVTGSLATGATYFGVIESTKKWLEEVHPNLGGHWAHFIAGALGRTLDYVSSAPSCLIFWNILSLVLKCMFFIPCCQIARHFWNWSYSINVLDPRSLCYIKLSIHVIFHKNVSSLCILEFLCNNIA